MNNAPKNTNIEESLKLLAHIERTPGLTQRELGSKLNISLGKVNFLINALAENGIIKLKRFKRAKSKRGYLYILTPKGMAEKAKITRKFLKSKMDEYERLRVEIEVLKGQVYREPSGDSEVT